MDLIGFLYGFGVLHGVLLAGILLYYSRGHRVANIFMAALVICIALRFLSNWLTRSGVFLDYPQWSIASVPLDFAWGPLLIFMPDPCLVDQWVFSNLSTSSLAC